MKHDLVPTPARNDPASAFEALRREVSLLRCGIEGLTADRNLVPDYTPTLTDLERRLAHVERLLEPFSRSPALQLTPESLVARIECAGEVVRARDRETITTAFATLQASIAGINGVVRQARTGRQQRCLLWGTGLGGLYFGVIGVSALIQTLG